MPSLAALGSPDVEGLRCKVDVVFERGPERREVYLGRSLGLFLPATWVETSASGADGEIEVWSRCDVGLGSLRLLVLAWGSWLVCNLGFVASVAESPVRLVKVGLVA